MTIKMFDKDLRETTDKSKAVRAVRLDTILGFKESESFVTEQKGAEGKLWRVCLIEAGTSKNKRRYSAELLKTSAPLFEGVKSFAYEFRDSAGNLFDHEPESIKEIKPQGFPRNVVGWFDNVNFEQFTNADGKVKEGLLADFHITEDATWLREKLRSAWEQGKRDLLGFSIDAQGVVAPVREGDDVIADVLNISAVDSVDIVSNAAAGGQCVRLVASFQKEKPMLHKFLEGVYDVVTAIDPSLTKTVTKESMTDELAAKLLEAAFTSVKGNPAHAGMKGNVRALKACSGKRATLKASATKESEAQLMEAENEGLEIINEIKEAFNAIKEAEAAKAKEAEGDEDDEETPEEKKKREEEEAATKESVKNSDELVESFKKDLGVVKTNMESLAEENRMLKISKKLSESSLPKISQDRLMEAFKGSKLTDKDVDGIIHKEREYLASINAGKAVSFAESIELGKDKDDKFRLAMDGFFENKNVDNVPRFRTLSEAFYKVTGKHPDNGYSILAESLRFKPTKLKEGMQTSDWAQILGDSVTRKMLSEYALDDLNVWRQLVSDITPIKDFRTQRRMRMGGYGTLSTVSERATYANLTSPTDEEATYAIAKKGGLEDLTLEMIANDDVGAIRRIPTKLGRAAALTLYRGIFDLLLNNSAVYDALALAEAGTHVNIGATALSNTTLNAAKQAMMKQTAYGNTAEILGSINNPAFLLVPSELEETALKLTTSAVYVNAASYYTGGGAAEGSTSPNLHATYGLKHLILPYWSVTDSNNWWLVANPKNIPTFEVGFYGGMEEPELFVQDMETVGSVFTADKITYKIRHIWGVAVLDFRSFYGAIVT